jgi:hypothetical protein
MKQFDSFLFLLSGPGLEGFYITLANRGRPRRILSKPRSGKVDSQNKFGT